jgi:hypothetical protein
MAKTRIIIIHPVRDNPKKELVVVVFVISHVVVVNKPRD